MEDLEKRHKESFYGVIGLCNRIHEGPPILDVEFSNTDTEYHLKIIGSPSTRFKDGEVFKVGKGHMAKARLYKDALDSILMKGVY